MTQAETIGEDSRIEDASLAYEAARLEDQGYDQAAELGIRSLASEQIEAHGRSYSVAEALRQCAPFAQMIASAAKYIPEDNRAASLEGIIRDMAASATSTPDVVRAQDDPAAHSEYVKKN